MDVSYNPTKPIHDFFKPIEKRIFFCDPYLRRVVRKMIQKKGEVQNSNDTKDR